MNGNEVTTHGAWHPTSEEYDAYKAREVKMAMENLRRVPDAARLSATTLHSSHTMLLAVAALRSEGKP